MTSLRALARQGFIGRPELDSQKRYKGLLPPTCGHSHARTVTGDDETKARLAGMAAYPEDMNLWLAHGILEAAAGPGAGEAGLAGAPSRPAAPTRACIRDVVALVPGIDIYIGRGDARRGFPPSRLQNPWKIGVHGTRSEVIAKFRALAEDSADVRLGVRGLMGKRLSCHCRLDEPCHGDVLIDLAVREHALLSTEVNTSITAEATPELPEFALEATEEMLKSRPASAGPSKSPGRAS